MNNANTIIGAVIAALILFLSSLVTLFVENSELTFGMIKQATWVSIIGGAIIAFLKDYQALSTRRLVNKVTHSGDGGGKITNDVKCPPVVGLLALLLAAVMIAGCVGTRAAYQKADDGGPEAIAKVMLAHYTALISEANDAAEAGELTGRALSHAQDVVRAGRKPVEDMEKALAAWQSLKSAETEAELDDAIVDAAEAISNLIDALKQIGVTSQVIDEIEQDIEPLLA